MLLLMRSGSALPCTISCHLPVSSHSCWSMVLLENSLLNFWSCISAPLCIIRSSTLRKAGFEFLLNVQVVDLYFWVQPDMLCRTIPTSCSCQAGCRPVTCDCTGCFWPLLLLIAVVGHSNLPAAGVSFPGALLQLLHDKTVLDLNYVIVVVVLVWKCFGMHNLKARECGLEEIITWWCSLSKCALWPQQKYCNQKYCLAQLTFSLSFQGRKELHCFPGVNIPFWEEVADSNQWRPMVSEEQGCSAVGPHTFGVLWV